LADPQTPQTGGFDFSPNTISSQDFQTIQAEREDFQNKQLHASNEFMFQHYARLLRMLDVSYERASKANIVLERKERRRQAKQRREALQASRTKR
jgi:uncharacterized phage-like protein YoqJ